MDLAEETKAMRIRPVKRLFGWLLDSHQVADRSDRENKGDQQEKQTSSAGADHRGNAAAPGTAESLSADADPGPGYHGNPVLFRDRLNELVQLTVHDVDLKDKILHIRKGKGNRQRVVPIGKNAAKYLDEYLRRSGPGMPKRTGRKDDSSSPIRASR